VPGLDANFWAWQLNFSICVIANLVAFGLTADDMAFVTAAQTGWGTAFSALAPLETSRLASTEAEFGELEARLFKLSG